MSNRDLWEMQSDFTNKFWSTKGGLPGDERITSTVKDYSLHIISEVMEVVGELPDWKMHRSKRGDLDRDNLLEELIDVQKFLMGLCQVLGYTYEQFEEEFRRKSMVVEQRFAQERSFPSLVNYPMALVDIDGVLADYPRGFYAWIQRSYPTPSSHSSVQRAEYWYKNLPLKDREETKRRYRQSGAKATLPVLPGAVELVRHIRERGLKVVLLTNRPYAEYYRIYPDTLTWLHSNGFEYDGILWARDKGLEAVKQFRNVCFAIDDNDENITRLREAKVPTIKVDPGDETRDTASLLGFARNSVRLEDLAYAWQRGVPA